MNAWEKVEKRIKEAKAQGKAYSDPPGLFSMYWQSIASIIFDGFANFFYLDWSLLIGSFVETNKTVTTCLRDDIWELKALQEQVLNELLKTALLWDHARSSALWEDFLWLDATIKDLRGTYQDTEKWFPDGLQNYYTDCPYGEFTQAFRELKESWDRFVDSLSFGNLQLGSLAEMGKVAEIRAKRRAAQWIAANQLQFTLGGKLGASRRSLFSGPGIDGLAADLKTELEFVVDFGEMIFDERLGTALSDLKKAKEAIAGSPLGIDELLDAHREAQEYKERAVGQMQTALTFNLQLNNVDEQVLIDIEEKLMKINIEIQKACSGEEKPLLEACKQLNIVLKKQGKNKNVEPVNCKQ